MRETLTPQQLQVIAEIEERYARDHEQRLDDLRKTVNTLRDQIIDEFTRLKSRVTAIENDNALRP